MTRQQINAYLVVILETLSEAPHGVPSGHMYAAMMGGAGLNLGEYQTLVQIAREGGLIKVAGSHLVTLTDKGRQLVEKIRAAKTAPEPTA
jgi:predicted transcriptional regulator